MLLGEQLADRQRDHEDDDRDADRVADVLGHEREVGYARYRYAGRYLVHHLDAVVGLEAWNLEKSVPRPRTGYQKPGTHR